MTTREKRKYLRLSLFWIGVALLMAFAEATLTIFTEADLRFFFSWYKGAVWSNVLAILPCAVITGIWARAKWLADQEHRRRVEAHHHWVMRQITQQNSREGLPTEPHPHIDYREGPRASG